MLVQWTLIFKSRMYNEWGDGTIALSKMKVALLRLAEFGWKEQDENKKFLMKKIWE
jgi:hypothetical protein